MMYANGSMESCLPGKMYSKSCLISQVTTSGGTEGVGGHRNFLLAGTPQSLEPPFCQAHDIFHKRVQSESCHGTCCLKASRDKPVA